MPPSCRFFARGSVIQLPDESKGRRHPARRTSNATQALWRKTPGKRKIAACRRCVMQRKLLIEVVIAALALAWVAILPACSPTPTYPPQGSGQPWGFYDGQSRFGDAAYDSGAATPTDAGPAKTDTGTPPKGGDTASKADAAPADAGPVDSGPPACKPTDPPDEKCDGIDNDCNGETDEASCKIPGNDCTVGKCDSEKALKGEDGCTYSQPEGVPCDDNDKCTEGDTCKGGACKSGAGVACDDNNVCTLDDCSADTGKCEYKTFPNGIKCDDSKPCTTADKCLAGKCTGQMNASCEDGQPCTSDDCDTTGACIHKSIDGAACTDGNACTQDDACGLGKCLPGKAVICNDNNKCTDDICDPNAGCVHKPKAEGKECSDGICSKGGKCDKQGVCAGEVGLCDDKNPCTDDTCTSITGCQHKQVAENTVCGPGLWCKSNAKVFTELKGKPKLPIPDNDPIGVFDTILFPDNGIAESLEVALELTNSDLSGVSVVLYDPNNTKYTLHENTSGQSIKTTYPTVSKPKDGNLYSWIGKNPKGKWRLLVVDLKFKDNGNDGEITAWSVKSSMTSLKMVCTP